MLVDWIDAIHFLRDFFIQKSECPWCASVNKHYNWISPCFSSPYGARDVSSRLNFSRFSRSLLIKLRFTRRCWEFCDHSNINRWFVDIADVLFQFKVLFSYVCHTCFFHVSSHFYIFIWYLKIFFLVTSPFQFWLASRNLFVCFVQCLANVVWTQT